MSTMLDAQGGSTGLPVRLRSSSGIAFLGAKVYGMGFVIDPDEAQEWIAKDTRNSEVLFPFLNGDDLNSRPDCCASRWVIDFNDRSEEEAATYPIPFARVLERVKPERMKLFGRNSSGNDRATNWWRFGRRTPALARAIAGLSEVLSIALVSKTVMPVRVPTRQVFSHALGVFATSDYGIQAVLSSSLHQLWAITYGSTLETRVRYTPSDVFETFPLPEITGELAEVGLALDQGRRVMMSRRNMGLTKLYNMVNDPTITPTNDHDIALLRDLHVQVDRAAAASYGWSDIELGHGHYAYRGIERWSVSPTARLALLERLLMKNHDAGNSK